LKAKLGGFLKMADKLYVGKGKNPTEAEENLFKSAKDAGVTNLEGTVQYEVSVAGKRGKRAVGKAHEDYTLAFASALSAAKVNPDKFDPAKNTYEVTAKATYQAPETGEHKPSGSAPNSYSGRSLTDLF